MGSPITNAWGAKMLHHVLMAGLVNCTNALDEPVKVRNGPEALLVFGVAKVRYVAY